MTRVEQNIMVAKREILFAIWDMHEAVWQPKRELKGEDFQNYQEASRRFFGVVEFATSIEGFPADWLDKGIEITARTMAEAKEKCEKSGLDFEKALEEILGDRKRVFEDGRTYSLNYNSLWSHGDVLTSIEQNLHAGRISSEEARKELARHLRVIKSSYHKMMDLSRRYLGNSEYAREDAKDSGIFERYKRLMSSIKQSEQRHEQEIVR